MKKATLIALLTFATLFTYAQKDTIGLNLPLVDGKIIYQSVIELPGRTQIELYKNSKQWFVDYFKSSKDVIQNDDKESGKVIGKGIIFVYLKTTFFSQTISDKITIQIDCKDGKYRYKIYDINLTVPSSYSSVTGPVPAFDFTAEDLIARLTDNPARIGYTKGQCRKILDSIVAETQSTISSLKTAMNAKTDDF